MSVALCALGQKASINLQQRGSHLFLKVKVKQGDSLLFGFDTGATVCFIDSTISKKIGLKADTKAMEEVIGNGGSQNFKKILSQTLRLAGNVSVKKVDLLMDDFSADKKMLGIEMNGIIGFDLFNSFVTQIDLENNVLHLYKKIGHMDTSGYTAVPFEFNKGINIPRFPISIVMADGSVFTGRVLFDTGAGVTLLVSAPFRNYHKLGDKFSEKRIVTASGMNGGTRDERGGIRSMKVAGFEFGPMKVNSSVNDRAVAADGYLGLLGMEIIKRFNVILDYKHKMLYLKPNKNFNLPFGRD